MNDRDVASARPEVTSIVTSFDDGSVHTTQAVRIPLREVYDVHWPGTPMVGSPFDDVDPAARVELAEQMAAIREAERAADIAARDIRLG